MTANTVQPVDRLVGHRLREVERLAVLALLNPDELLVLGDHRVVLTGLGRQEPPVVVKPPGVGPVIKRTGGTLLLLRRQMPLTDPCRGVAVLLEHLRERRRVFRQHRRVARKATRHLRDAAHPNRVMVTAGQQRRPRRRAHRGHVKPVVPQALCGDPIVVRGVDRPAEGARVTEPGVIDQHDQHVRGAVRGLHVTDLLPVRLRTPERLIRDAGKRRTADRQLRAVDRFITHRRSPSWCFGGWFRALIESRGRHWPTVGRRGCFDASAEHVERPALVGDHERDEQDRDDGHHFQRVGA
jgi:hypothetical protein